MVFSYELTNEKGDISDLLYDPLTYPHRYEGTLASRLSNNSAGAPPGGVVVAGDHPSGSSPPKSVDLGGLRSYQIIALTVTLGRRAKRKSRRRRI